MASDLLRGAAAAIWEQVDGRGGVPKAAYQAAQDLLDLYETLNNAPVSQLVRRTGHHISGADLAWFAMAPGEPAIQAIYVPTFEVRLEHGELVWEGGERRVRNPSSSVPVALLIEDEPKHQASTAKMIGKVLPQSQIVIADNADAAIADLQHHNVVVVVSDYDILGSKSGLDVFRWVQQNQPHLANRYLFFSGNMDVHDSGAAVLMKPAGFADFKAAVLALGDRPAPTRRPATVAPPIEPAPKRVADAVRAAIPSVRQEQTADGRARGRFGDKVFISAIWRVISQQGALPGMTSAEFKRALVEANRDSLLVLARADLVAAMEHSEVMQSEIEDRGATFHFVKVPDGSRSAVDRRPATVAPPIERAPRSMSTEDVAAAVRTVMPSISGTLVAGRAAGRFGDQKVFISAIWDRLASDPSFRGVTLEQFKRHLLDANRMGLLVLARADAPGAMDIREVEGSEIADRGSTFHFVLDRSGWRDAVAR